MEATQGDAGLQPADREREVQVFDAEESAGWDHRIRALSRVSAAVSGLSDLDAILRVGLDGILDIMQGSAGAVYLLDHQSRTLHRRASEGLSPGAGGRSLKAGECIEGKVAESGRAVLLEDSSRDTDSPTAQLVVSGPVRSLAAIPLRAGDKTLGVISVASSIPRRFGKNDMYLLHSVGDQMGIAVERAELYEHLREGRERYRRLARHCLVAQEEERRRIARELHDETSQSLSGLALSLRALVDLAEMSGKEAELIERLKKVDSLAAHTSSELGRLINDLRPALLDTVGLAPAIRQYAQDKLQPLGINVSIEQTGDCQALPPEIELTLFRFAQGAVMNIVQHSQARNAAITLDCRRGEILLRISDDGIGFDVSAITGIEDSGRGRGLFTMKERISLLGGSCFVRSSPGKGTTAQAMVPLEGT